jgi:SnoaL-like domain
MTGTPADEGLEPDLDDADLETLRNAFVEAYNARDLDAILTLVATDAELPDVNGEGPEALAEELQAVWARSPVVVLTRALVKDVPAAVAWLPDEHGHWTRAGLMTFDSHRGRLTVVEMPDDVDCLQAALADDPGGDVLDEELDWSEWDRGEPSGDGDGDWHERQLPESWST